MESMNMIGSVIRGIAIIIALVFTVGGVAGVIYWRKSQLQGDN